MHSKIVLGERWLAMAHLGGAAVAGLLWLAGDGQLSWQPLLVALLPWAAKLATGRAPFERTPFDLPVIVFLLTATLGLWAAHDWPAAWSKFWLLVGAVFLFYALAGQPAGNLWPIIALVGGLGVLVAGYFLLTNDWQATPLKFGLVTRVGGWWMAVRPFRGGQGLHPNVAASLMAMSLPFLLALGRRTWRLEPRWATWLVGAAALLVAGALWLTASRGAWLALALAAGAWLLWQASPVLARRLAVSRQGAYSGLLLVALGVALVVALALPGGPVWLLDRLPGPASASGRWALSQQTWDLIGDFPFTGGGLAAFPGLHAHYILLLPVYFLPNGHNLFLDMALEQGLLGAVALAAVLPGAVWLLTLYRRPQRCRDGDAPLPANLSAVRWAIAAGLLIMLAHGLVEDTVYGSQAAPLLLVLPGLAVMVTRFDDRSRRKQALLGRQMAQGVLLAGLLGLAHLTVFHRSWRASWQANLGALEMARVELAAWPGSGWNDGSHATNLQAAEQRFASAVERQPLNRTANHRLGLIASLRRDYAAAADYLENAYRTDGNHRGLQKALGYSYVWLGQFDRAEELLRQVPEAGHELEIYSWWWAERERVELSRHAAEMALRLDGPEAMGQTGGSNP